MPGCYISALIDVTEGTTTDLVSEAIPLPYPKIHDMKCSRDDGPAERREASQFESNSDKSNTNIAVRKTWCPKATFATQGQRNPQVAVVSENPSFHDVS